jgi:hypothetical protein
MRCCSESELADIRAVWVARRACVTCGALPATPEVRLEESFRLMLLARERIGSSGDWRSLGLPRFHRIGRTVGPAVIVPTLRRRRVHETFERLSDANLEGLIRRYMGLPATLWPRAVHTAVWPHPIIIHPGLAQKFARKRDRDHIFLCGYTYDAIAFPTEVWHGTHNGKPHVRFLKKLATANDVHTLLVSVDSASSIVATSYILDPQQYDVNREGTFLFASWAAPQ